jgi:hypothetical protein
MRMKLLQIVEPFHRRWSKRDSFPGLHSTTAMTAYSSRPKHEAATVTAPGSILEDGPADKSMAECTL